ncbi:hypothetical protein [Methanolapillus millepedarum]|uniref:Uncharacterized protein n=1 Tax=Methanolapillus millepedarum TaxID=3028296 RepID=A0AA96V6K1_9EURY|nr:hypothetical protein MsAc7_16300 [Methanosarcinaceae archaeon Ac7]
MEITPKTMGQVVVLVLIILFALLAADEIYDYYNDERVGETCVSSGNVGSSVLIDFKETGIPIGFVPANSDSGPFEIGFVPFS